LNFAALPNQVGRWTWKPKWKYKLGSSEVTMNNTQHVIYTTWGPRLCSPSDFNIDKLRYSCEIEPASTLNEVASRLALKVNRDVGPWWDTLLLYWYVNGDDGRRGQCYAENSVLKRALAVIGIESQLDWAGEHRDVWRLTGKGDLQLVREYHWFQPRPRFCATDQMWNFEYFNVVNGRVYDAHLAHNGALNLAPRDYKKKPEEPTSGPGADADALIFEWDVWDVP